MILEMMMMVVIMMAVVVVIILMMMMMMMMVVVHMMMMMYCSIVCRQQEKGCMIMILTSPSLFLYDSPLYLIAISSLCTFGIQSTVHIRSSLSWNVKMRS